MGISSPHNVQVFILLSLSYMIPTAISKSTFSINFLNEPNCFIKPLRNLSFNVFLPFNVFMFALSAIFAFVIKSSGVKSVDSIILASHFHLKCYDKNKKGWIQCRFSIPTLMEKSQDISSINGSWFVFLLQYPSQFALSLQLR